MGLISFFKDLFSKDTVEALDDTLGDVVVVTGKALAQAEVDKALDDLAVEAAGIGDLNRRAAILAGIGSLRVAVTAFIAAVGEGE